jgi:hypothetical protein
MDDRTRKTYPTRDDAIKAGVPLEHIKEVNITTLTSGPFKGRSYEVLPDGKLGKRVYPVENKNE